MIWAVEGPRQAAQPRIPPPISGICRRAQQKEFPWSVLICSENRNKSEQIGTNRGIPEDKAQTGTNRNKSEQIGTNRGDPLLPTPNGGLRLLHAMGLWVSQYGQIGCNTLPYHFYLRCDTPCTAGISQQYLLDTISKQGKTRAIPLCDVISKRYCVMRRGMSLSGPLRQVVREEVFVTMKVTKWSDEAISSCGGVIASSFGLPMLFCIGSRRALAEPGHVFNANQSHTFMKSWRQTPLQGMLNLSCAQAQKRPFVHNSACSKFLEGLFAILSKCSQFCLRSFNRNLRGNPSLFWLGGGGLSGAKLVNINFGE